MRDEELGVVGGWPLPSKISLSKPVSHKHPEGCLCFRDRLRETLQNFCFFDLFPGRGFLQIAWYDKSKK
jgi:hypothetical protein